eukprot:gene9937-7807_t
MLHHTMLPKAMHLTHRRIAPITRPSCTSAQAEQAVPPLQHRDAPKDAPKEDKPKKQKTPKGTKPPTPKGSKPAASSASSPEEIRAVRIQKAETLRAAGKEPYAYRFDRTHYTTELQEALALFERGPVTRIYRQVLEDESADVAVAGRLMAKRVMGKLAFLSIRDDRGEIQLYCEKARLEEVEEGGFAVVKGTCDVGDIVGARGHMKRTEKGELSVMVKSGLEILTKSLLPLPDKWHGLTDIEKRYRQRYVDMIVTEDTRKTFRARSKIVSTIRRHRRRVETPVLVSAVSYVKKGS